MTPTLATIRFESAYLLCHVNAIDAHPMRIQFDSLWMRIETGLHVNAPLVMDHPDKAKSFLLKYSVVFFIFVYRAGGIRSWMDNTICLFLV